MKPGAVLEHQSSFNAFEDDNSRALFNSQSVDSSSVALQDDSRSAFLSETENPILRRANIGKISKSNTINDDSRYENEQTCFNQFEFQLGLQN